MISYEEGSPRLAYGSINMNDVGLELNAGRGTVVITGVTENGMNWKHDITNEDFSKFDYVMLNGVRFNRA